MEDSESYFIFPPPFNHNDGNNNNKTSYREELFLLLMKALTEDNVDKRIRAVLAGIHAVVVEGIEGMSAVVDGTATVVAGTVLLVVAYFLASSVFKISVAVAGIALVASGVYSLASSASKIRTVVGIAAVVVGAALLAFGAYSLTSFASLLYDDGDNSRRRATQMENLEFEAAGIRSCQNPRNHISSVDNYTLFTKESPAAGGPRERSALRMIKIMSYNVRSLEIEDILVDKRMKEIGHLIEEHSPDIIFLQEMTRHIYEIFQSCRWWELYECPVPPEKATRKHFCMQLSKLPAKKFCCKSLDNSTTGRGLCVAAISAGTKRKLIAATCQLKRPDDAHEHTEEQVIQVKQALSSLNIFPNVVFGGDMNWNESSDGRFPLSGEWQDAWSVLRPGEDGYTYDTKSNPMLNHTGSLQGRLDRFVCKLEDFEVINIEMIGTEAIPGISLLHNGQKLPILPSDHYGLILTICPKQLISSLLS